MKIQFAGIKRKENYSPNHITNDTLILNKTADVLRNMGHEVNVYDECFIEENNIEEKFIFSMAQGYTGIKRLQEIGKRSNAMILNKPEASLNSYRAAMIRILSDAGIPFPKSVMLDKDNFEKDFFSLYNAKKIWLKRGDVHAEHKEDVTLIYSQNELDTTLQEFLKRGIDQAIIQEHLPGDTVKFYGVRGTNFLCWYYLNGNNNISFNVDQFKALAFSSAEVLGLDIFGGDIIVSPQGTMSVIDVNDWPSFAPVRDEAANYIGNLIYKKALNHDK